MRRPSLFPLSCVAFLLWATGLAATELEPRHSYANHEEMKVTHTHLKLTVDFDRKVLSGRATLSVKRLKGDILWLDAQKLKIKKIDGDIKSWQSIVVSTISEVGLGEPLKIVTQDQDDLTIHIDYETDPTAPGLVWMNANQTRSGYPFMFAMNEAANYRGMAPGQDTPAVRGTFSADLSIAKGEQIKEPFMALISGQNNPREPNREMIYENLRSDVPIPTYLFVLAAGRFKYQSQDARIGYYADNDETLRAALEGFKNTPRYFERLETLLGPCHWQRQDFLFLPAMFGFGGMENPGLPYINEGLVEKTGSSSYVIAHELAHMKTGNEVTNKAWPDFWLNEGWTTYYEKRILGDIYGQSFREGAAYEEYLELLAADHERVSHQEELKHQPTRLFKRDAWHVHPDKLTEFSVYSKGANMLYNIEMIIGRESFDAFAQNYIKHFTLEPIDTKTFIEYSAEKLAELHSNYDWHIYLRQWIYEPGQHPNPSDLSLEKISTPQCAGCEEKVEEFERDKERSSFSRWNRFQIAYLLNRVKKNLEAQQESSAEDLASLLHCHSFLESIEPIADIKSQWYRLLIASGQWKQKQEEIEIFLSNFGRGRVIRPIYQELLNVEDKDAYEFAKKIFANNKDRYFHQVTGSIQGLFERHGQ